MARKRKSGKKNRSRRINDWLHLWLGLVSGIIVLVVSLTGCIYVFKQEITDFLEPWRFVEARDLNFVPPSRLLDTAAAYMPGMQPTGLTYSNAEGAAAVGYMHDNGGKHAFSVVFMDPYTGAFLKRQDPIGYGNFDFFQFILDGHRALWLPYEIGRPVVGVATLVFIALLITGMVMWWPGKWNRATKKKSFSIGWRTRFKRLNYDLHNVLGFYSLILAFVIAVTGLVWSFNWFEQGLYYLTSGGETKSGHHHPHSDMSGKDTATEWGMPPLDKAWYLTLARTDRIGGMYMTPVLADEDDPIEVTVYHDYGTYYDHSEYFYDRYTLDPLEQEGSTFAEAGFADRLAMMNYDIHIGAIGGLAGKLLAFFASLICASLPVTGFLVWWNKRKR